MLISGERNSLVPVVAAAPLRSSDPMSKRKPIKELERKFAAEGFRKYETVLGGEGVGVLWPAVFRNGADGEGGEEIN